MGWGRRGSDNHRHPREGGDPYSEPLCVQADAVLMDSRVRGNDDCKAMSIITLYALFADADEAARIGRAVVEARLAACVNILAPCRSIYRWQDRIEDATEVPALFKTRADRADALIAEIRRLHSYEVPAIVAWPIAAALPEYSAWVGDQVI
jgi:periplasmic divalent cation tolerance protein